MTLAGHRTSVSLEPLFWTALEDEAARGHISLNQLITRIDHARLADGEPANLSSALRVHVLAGLLASRDTNPES